MADSFSTQVLRLENNDPLGLTGGGGRVSSGGNLGTSGRIGGFAGTAGVAGAGIGSLAKNKPTANTPKEKKTTKEELEKQVIQAGEKNKERAEEIKKEKAKTKEKVNAQVIQAGETSKKRHEEIKKEKELAKNGSPAAQATRQTDALDAYDALTNGIDVDTTTPGITAPTVKTGTPAMGDSRTDGKAATTAIPGVGAGAKAGAEAGAAAGANALSKADAKAGSKEGTKKGEGSTTSFLNNLWDKLFNGQKKSGGIESKKGSTAGNIMNILFRVAAKAYDNANAAVGNNTDLYGLAKDIGGYTSAEMSDKEFDSALAVKQAIDTSVGEQSAIADLYANNKNFRAFMDKNMGIFQQLFNGIKNGWISPAAAEKEIMDKYEKESGGNK